MKRLEGKSVLITGSARGIGRAFAEACIREGAKVAVAADRMANFLASAEADDIAAQTCNVDGGNWMR